MLISFRLFSLGGILHKRRLRYDDDDDTTSTRSSQLRWQRGCLSLSYSFKLKSASGCAGSRRAASHRACACNTDSQLPLWPCHVKVALSEIRLLQLLLLQWKRFNFTAIHSTLQPDNNLAQLAAGGQARGFPTVAATRNTHTQPPTQQGQGGKTMETAIE